MDDKITPSLRKWMSINQSGHIFLNSEYISTSFRCLKLETRNFLRAIVFTGKSTAVVNWRELLNASTRERFNVAFS